VHAFGSIAEDDSMVCRSPIAASILAAALLLTIVGTQVVAQDIQVRSCPATPALPTIEQLQVGMRTARNRGFLWRISKNGRNSYSTAPCMLRNETGCI
jgi:hypothetical protein